jgi:hypothetical protein
VAQALLRDAQRATARKDVMSLISRIKDVFRPKLRNRAGGMAWVRGVRSGMGAEDLNGRAVKTVCLTEGGLWEIDPPQCFIATRQSIFGARQVLVLAGQVVRITAVADELLEPWREVGDDDQCQSHRYLPPVPTINRKEPQNV